MQIGLIIMIVLFMVGVPIWISLSIGGLLLSIISVGSPVANIPLTFWNGIDSFTLMAITFFLLAGAIMAYCGPSKYIFDVVNSFFGQKRGGLAITAVVMSMIYAAITGSSTATLAGVAEFARPEMIKKGYTPTYIASLMAASCTLGQMIPPSILMILYGSMVQVNTGVLFIAGIIPGILSGLVLCSIAWWTSPKINKMSFDDIETYSWKNRIKCLIKGFPALFMPVAVLGAIYSGFVTPTEAGGLAVVYSIGISILYRKLNWKTFVDTMKSTITSNSMIFILIAGALLFANPIAFLQIPQMISQAVIKLGLNSIQLMIATFGVLILLGMVIDVIPILYLTIPAFYPALVASGVNLVHFNIVMILALQIGQISPPFGTALYVSAGINKAPIDQVARGVIKYIVAYTIITVIIILIPQLSLWLPSIM